MRAASPVVERTKEEFALEFNDPFRSGACPRASTVPVMAEDFPAVLFDLLDLVLVFDQSFIVVPHVRNSQGRDAFWQPF
jgi:hypothetical protein